MSYNRPYTTRQSNISIDPDDTGLVLGYDMEPSGITIPDLSDSSNHGTLVNAPIFQIDNFGQCLFFGSVDNYINVPDSASIDLSAQITISAFFYATALNHASGGNSPRIIDKSSAYVLLVTNLGAIQFITYGTGTPTLSTAGNVVTANRLYHVVATYNSTTGAKNIYLNGTVVATSTDSGTITTNANDLRVGGSSTANRSWYGNIYYPKIFNVAKDIDWVTEEYQKGLYAAFKTDYGADISPAPYTACCLGNTPFSVKIGSFQISTDTIDSIPVKVIECTSVGASVCSMPAGFFSANQYLRAYGRFTWWMLKSQASYNATGVTIIASVAGQASDPAQNGYRFRINNAQQYILERRINGASTLLAYSGVGAINVGEWYKYEIVREPSGQFTYYVDDVLGSASGGGSNPVTDTTHSTSAFFVIEVYEGDKIAYASGDGSIHLKKTMLP